MPRGGPLLRRLRLPFRHECIDCCRNGGSNAGYRLTKAVPCHWTIAAVFLWCWLEVSNPPPLAYKASALPDELSQPGELTKGARRRSRCGSELERAGNPTPRPILDVHNVKERGATGTVSHAQTKPWPRARAHTRAPKA